MMTDNLQDAVMLVASGPLCEEIKNVLRRTLSKPNIKLFVVNSASEAFLTFLRLRPCLVITTTELSDMRGSSFCAILKDMDEAKGVTVYLIGSDKYIPFSKADFFFVNNNFSEIKDKILDFFDQRYMKITREKELEFAILQQKRWIPERYWTNEIEINRIFSPFQLLSGDGIGFWPSKDKRKIFGYVFDCTGHNFISHINTGAIRALLQTQVKFYENGIGGISLSDALKLTNVAYFDINNQKPDTLACIVFALDLDKREMTYCSAGITNFLLRHRGQANYEQVDTPNTILGFSPNASFDEGVLPIDDSIEEIILCTDGYSELVKLPELPPVDEVKHDDVAAIFIHFNNKKTDRISIPAQVN